eukprot:CAMPEP_0204223250 /NCGR_PEP_ID=MMETSP0361-20130328/82691_1 /ASSEMBLY_ACC=CAM_ASM_000343 /TAXON_ID=268821 /ORGANISM="Scrippsiella Hangoei, Strain SHTV-5" /LENGTH=72 /DNA_ID=CAMNT_0051188941 /DNA_START=20 /DNA_END=236 /DNA_ORIENTATION=-
MHLQRLREECRFKLEAALRDPSSFSSTHAAHALPRAVEGLPSLASHASYSGLVVGQVVTKTGATRPYAQTST